MQIRKLGYAIVASVFTEGECDELLFALESSMLVRSRAGARHLLSVPPIAKLASDKRSIAMATEILDQPAKPFRVTLFDKSASANWSVIWHQDTALPVHVIVDAQGW